MHTTWGESTWLLGMAYLHSCMKYIFRSTGVLGLLRVLVCGQCGAPKPQLNGVDVNGYVEIPLHGYGIMTTVPGKPRHWVPQARN